MKKNKYLTVIIAILLCSFAFSVDAKQRKHKVSKFSVNANKSKNKVSKFSVNANKSKNKVSKFSVNANKSKNKVSKFSVHANKSKHKVSKFSVHANKSKNKVAEFHVQPIMLSLPNGISSGDTTTHSTVLWARSSVSGNIKFTVRADKQSYDIYKKSVYIHNPDLPAKVLVDDLHAGTQYQYTVTSVTGEKLKGTFKTAADNYNIDKGLRFGVSGDWRGELAPYPAIKNAADKKLDFFIKLGDTVYADFPSPAVDIALAETLKQSRDKHNEVYSYKLKTNIFADLQSQTSIFSTIDDHEVINDFAGGASASSDSRFPELSGLINQTKLYRNGMQAFNEFNAIKEQVYPKIGDSRTDGRPKFYRAQQYGSVASIFILDARSFRDQQLANVTELNNPQQIATFIASSFDAFNSNTRTMLGKRQLQQLKADLLVAHDNGITWKFIAVPEPIQNLGVITAADRFEGYASERTELLQFIDENDIQNVVFIAADVHGTIINDLSYQRKDDVLQALSLSGNPLLAPQISTTAFEITTGSTAYYPAFGDAINSLLPLSPGGELLLDQMLRSVGVYDLKEFNKLPMKVKNSAMEVMINQQLNALGYTPIGLEDNLKINAKLTKGQNTALFSFGWTKFEIKPKSHVLKITTYGIEPYSEKELTKESSEILKRIPKVVIQLSISPNK